MARKTVFLIAIFFIAANLGGCDKLNIFNLPFLNKKAVAKTSGAVLARVNKWTLTLNEFNRRLAALKTAYNVEVKSFEDKKLVLEELVQRELLAQEAEKKGIGKNPDIQLATEDFRKGLLVTEYANKYIGNIDVSPKEIEGYYNQYKEAFKKQPEIKAREIVTKTEEEAKTILIDLLSGKYSFAAAAREYSISPSAKDGGDLGYVKKGTLFPKFDDVIFSLDKGGISSVFKGPQGYYIVTVEDVKEGGITPLSEVYDDIKAFLKTQKQNEAVKKTVDQLRANATVEVREDLLK